MLSIGAHSEKGPAPALLRAEKGPRRPEPIMHPIEKIARLTESLLNALMVMALVAMIVLVFINVVLRYGFNSGISVSVELSRFLFVWVTFLGAVVALLQQQHLGVTSLVERLPELAQKILQRLVTLAMLGCTLMLLVGSYKQTLLNWDNLSPISGLPVGVFYLAGLISGVLMSIVLLYRVFVPAGPVAELPEVE